MRPVRRSPGERYFREPRRIDVDEITDVLERTNAIGWHPAVYFKQPGHPLHGQRLGCRTYIDANLNKICKAKTLGSPLGIVRLSQDDEVLGGLFLAEGLETALTAMALGLRPTWSTGSSGTMKQFPVLSGITSLTILGDHDANGAGERAARECGERWLQAGREVRAFMPSSLGDFNDILKGLI